MVSQIYSCSLSGSRYLLADERNKKHLMDLLFRMLGRTNCPIYAFCITDDAAYVITETGQKAELIETLTGLAKYFFQIYEGFPDDSRYMKLLALKEIEDMPELADRCRELHLLPVGCGYVSRPLDYWWSSYRAYLNPNTELAVEREPLFFWFSDSREEAIRKLKHYHAVRLKKSRCNARR